MIYTYAAETVESTVLHIREMSNPYSALCDASPVPVLRSALADGHKICDDCRDVLASRAGTFTVGYFKVDQEDSEE